MNTKEGLIAARKLIEKPENWCKEAFATDKNGCKVRAKSDRAFRFCMMGALQRVSLNQLAEINPVSRLRSVIPSLFLSTFNDHPDTTHEMVLEKFDAAIALS